LELARILEELTDPACYPHPVDAVILRQTHISAVFLAGPYAYKLKKPLDLGFLDFTTLEKRRHLCTEEVRLNRRLARGVYLGVVPIAVSAGRLRVDGPGEIVEWAVWMERLPDAGVLGNQVTAGKAGPEVFQELGRRIAAFHGRAEAGEHVSRFGRFPVVARNVRENFEQTRAHVGLTVSGEVFARLRELTEGALAQREPLIESRARRGVPRDTHGDLHLDHVYHFPDRPPPDDLLIIDCIEFNERFRYADPVSDAAFLAMDLAFAGRPDLAAAFESAYFASSQDEEGRELLAFYKAYRAVVRAKVEGFKASEAEVPEPDRSAALERAKAHWLLALSELEEPARRPCLVLCGGLPGTGKSALAKGLTAAAGLRSFSSDLIRKELAGLSPDQSAAGAFGGGIYTAAWNDRTYEECLRRAEAALLRGERALVDASFREEGRRRQFLDLAGRLRVPALFFLRTAGPEVVRERLGRRKAGASDADWAIYTRAADLWEPLGPETRRVLREVPPAETKDGAVQNALLLLRAEGL
jgi:uncharacterized protein